MKEQLTRAWKSGSENAASQADRALAHTCAGRVVSALTFIMELFFLGLWITSFLLFYDRLFAQTLSRNVLTNLTCLVFFGGLVLACIIGAMAGNFLRRFFWKMLVKRFSIKQSK
jgi:hypothetical protein